MKGRDKAKINMNRSFIGCFNLIFSCSTLDKFIFATIVFFVASAVIKRLKTKCDVSICFWFDFFLLLQFEKRRESMALSLLELQQKQKSKQTFLVNYVSKRMSLINDHCTTISGHFFAICMFLFHKTEVLTVILRCLTGLTYDWLKSYDTKGKYFHFFVFLWFCTKTDIYFFCVFCVFAFFVITYVPIQI